MQRTRKHRPRLTWRRYGRAVELAGNFASELIGGHALFLLTILFGAFLTLCVRWVATYVNDPHFAVFAHLMHIIVLAADGLIFVIWLLRWIVSSLKEGP